MPRTSALPRALRRLARAPSADNSSPSTESQVFRRILTYVGTGFDYVEVDVEQQLADTIRYAVAPLQRESAALQQTISALEQEIAELRQNAGVKERERAASQLSSDDPTSKRARSE